MGPSHYVALFDLSRRAEQNHPDVLLFQIKDYAFGSGSKLNQFVREGVGKAVHPGDAVAHCEHAAHLFELNGGIEPLQLSAQYLGNLGWFYVCVVHTITLLKISALFGKRLFPWLGGHFLPWHRRVGGRFQSRIPR